MGYSKEVRQEAARKISSRRANAERDAELRREKIYAQVPQAREYERKIASCGIEAGRTVLRGGDVKQELENLRNKSRELRREYEQLLGSKGYTLRDIEPKYYCPHCNDTGYIEQDNRTVMCNCLRRAMLDAACKELNAQSNFKFCKFEDFNLGFYSMDVDSGFPRSPYEQMRRNLDFCKRYAEGFGKSSGSILMRGATGLGKTHLSLSIADVVTRKGYGVVYISAPVMVKELEKEHFSRDREDTSIEDTLLGCDLLIIDDLGTEFNTQFSTKAIYNIFNTRLIQSKPVIINTNMTYSEMEETYSQRFVSRIGGETTRLEFFGTDVRLKKV